MADQAFIDIVQLTETLVPLCAELATAAGAEVRVHPDLEALRSPPPDSRGVLVVAPGPTADLVAALAARRGAAVVVVGAGLSSESVVQLARAGAHAVVDLPAELGELRAWLEGRVQAAVVDESVRVQVERHAARFAPGQLIGRGPAMQTAIATAVRAILLPDAPVLITGEPGTGKERFARTIHHSGPRQAAPFVSLDCGASPPDLLEAELFGVEPGALPQAHASRPGLLETARGGTVFLDEVQRLPLPCQVRLLRLLTEGMLRRVGGSGEVALDVRIIAAGAGMEKGVRAGSLRADLYAALGEIRIELPPLRERGDDVVELAERFLAAEDPTRAPTLPPQVRATLLSHAWPGNLWELHHAIERAVLLGGGELRVDDLIPGTIAGGGAPGGRRPGPHGLEVTP